MSAVCCCRSCCQSSRPQCACRNADTLKRLQDTEKQLKDQTEAAYVNLDVSNEEKEKGNQVDHHNSLSCSCLECVLPSVIIMTLVRKAPRAFLFCTEQLHAVSDPPVSSAAL